MAKKKFDPAEFQRQLAEKLRDSARAPNIKKYTPHEKQYIFHSSTKKKKLYIGGNRSGKTTGGVCEGIWRASGTHPYRPELNVLGPTRGRVIGVDFTQGIDKIILPQYQQWVAPSMLRGGSWETAYEKSARVLNFANGSTIEFMSYDQDLDKFAGTSRHWVHFDEEPPQPIFGENLARLIDTDGEFFMTMTPVEGMTWIYEDLYEPNIGKSEADSKVLIIEINSLENPFLKAEALESFAESMDDGEVATRIGGGFIQQGGRVFKNFDPTPGGLQVLPLEWDVRGHNVKELFPPRDWLHAISLDHGLNNPTAVLWYAINRDGFIIVYDEHYKKEWTVDQHAAEINRRVARHGVVPSIWVADPSIANRNGITNTSVQEEYQKYGISWMLGNNDVKSGIVRVKKYFNPHKLINQNYKHSLFTYELSRKLQKQGDSTDLHALPGQLTFAKLRIMPNCENLIHEAKRYRWKTYTNKKLQFENNAYDEPHKKDDHAMDSLRYMIMNQPDLAAEPSEFMKDVRAALDSTSIEETLNGLTYTATNLADPYGVTNRNEWSPGMSAPVGDGGWTVDEHVGGMY